jgi:putative Mg2+ transporter-C (MgtC) family protein
LLYSEDMETWWEATGWAQPEGLELVRLVSRLASAAVLGSIVGFEREMHGMEAGLRTHMLVALGAALFILIPVADDGSAAELAHVVKGVASGIGFIGAGAILKLAAEREIKGLTTAASIWLTAAVGLAAGAGQMWSALISVLLSLFILAVLGRFEERFSKPRSTDTNKPAKQDPLPPVQE